MAIGRMAFGVGHDMRKHGSEIEIANKRTACGGAKALRSPNSSTLARTAAESTTPQQLDSK